MSTSGLSSFNLDLTELVEEAFERCGKELRTGYDLKTARRSINLMSIEWANRGINLWTIEQGQIPMVTGQAIYPLPIDTIDLLDTVIRTGSGQNQIDINITRISESTYITIPTKNAQGRPIQVWINRQSGNTNAISSTLLNGSISATDTTITVASAASLPSSGFVKIDNEIIVYQNVSGNQLLNCFRGQANTTAAVHSTLAPVTQIFLPNINVWPTPNPPGDQYTFVYYRMRRIQDSGGGVSTQDIPFRFITCLVAGLAFNLSVKLPEVDPNRVLFLKQDYEQQFQLAADEDREKASIRFVPRQLFY
jgi:hypothetical protein